MNNGVTPTPQEIEIDSASAAANVGGGGIGNNNSSSLNSNGQLPPMAQAANGHNNNQVIKKTHSQVVETTSQHSSVKKTSRGSSRIAIIDIDPFDVKNDEIFKQMVLHYTWYGLLLVVSHYSGWIYVWFYTIPLYAFISYVVVEVTRIIHILNPISLAPLYLSFLPYVLFHMLSREAHTIFTILWFISLMAITLQLGTNKLRHHIIFSVLSYEVIYAALTVAMKVVYDTHDVTTINGIESVIEFPPAGKVAFRYQNSGPCNTETTSEREYVNVGGNCYIKQQEGFQVNTGSEITFLVAVVLVGLGLFMLQRFIQDYAYSLLDRKNHVTNLSKINADLKDQLKALKVDVNLDLDSPITKVIKVIKGIQQNCELDADMMDQLDHVVEILSSNQLFLPSFFKEAKDGLDNDINKWLNNMVLNQASSRNDQSKSIAQLDAFALQEVVVKEVQPNSNAINEALANVDSWDFDIFELVEASAGRPLYYLGVHLFEKHGFKELYQIDDQVLRNFLKTLESGYKSNPYHNSTHAADVMHAVHYFIATLGLNELVTPDDCFAGMIAALIHDFDHPGLNNAFLINTTDNLAVRYNDSSVLEHYHCAKAFELLLDPSNEYNILAKLPREKFKQIRTSILTMVMATDMAGHFEYIAKFKNKTSGSGLDLNDAKDRQLIMDIAVKCGDINNASKCQHLCTKWAELIMEEFWNQGDEEKRRNIPVSMFMDRDNCIVHKCQLGFIDYIVTPLYEVWDAYMNEDEIFPGFENVSKNRDYWKSLAN